MFAAIFAILTNSVDWTQVAARRLHAALTALLLLVVLVLTPIMLGFNSYGLKEVNYLFFVFGGLFIIISSSHPNKLEPVAGIGAVAGQLSHTGIAHGAGVALMIYLRIVHGVLLGFWVLSGFMATWSFEGSAMAFLPFAAGCLVLGVIVTFYGISSGKYFKGTVIVYALAIMAIALWNTSTGLDIRNGVTSTIAVPLALLSDDSDDDHYREKPRTIAVDFIIPAGEEKLILRELRCSVDTRSAIQKKNDGIVRTPFTDKNGVLWVKYTSTNTTDLKERIWFYDENGPCDSDYQKLVAERAFI